MSIYDSFNANNDGAYKKIKGTPGDDKLKSTSANEKIYLYAGADTVEFSSKHGNDNIYAPEGNKTLVFTNNLDDIKVKRKNNSVLLQTKNSKNKTETVTIEKYLTGTSDIIVEANGQSKNLMDYLVSETYILGNSELKVAQTINGSRLDNELFMGGKGKDTINVFAGSGNVIIGSKGNDKINLQNSTDNLIIISKKDGNDTITFNNSLDCEKIATLFIDDIENVSYQPLKQGNDLIFDVIHTKSNNANKTVHNKIKIKDAFDSEGNLSNKLY